MHGTHTNIESPFMPAAGCCCLDSPCQVSYIFPMFIKEGGSIITYPCNLMARLFQEKFTMLYSLSFMPSVKILVLPTHSFILTANGSGQVLELKKF